MELGMCADTVYHKDKLGDIGVGTFFSDGYVNSNIDGGTDDRKEL